MQFSCKKKTEFKKKNLHSNPLLMIHMVLKFQLNRPINKNHPGFWSPHIRPHVKRLKASLDSRQVVNIYGFFPNQSSHTTVRYWSTYFSFFFIYRHMMKLYVGMIFSRFKGIVVSQLIYIYIYILVCISKPETTASACAKCRTMETFKKGLHGKTKLHI